VFSAHTDSLRVTTLKIIAIALVILLALQITVSEFIIGRSFYELEERSTRNAMQQTLKLNAPISISRLPQTERAGWNWRACSCPT